MSGRKVKLELTVPQARALWMAARYCDEFPEDSWSAQELAVLQRASGKLGTAIDVAEGAA